jgi:hypothetical protein
MALFKIGGGIKPQKFNYIPRYYDPVKEEREARIREAMGTADMDPESIKDRIKRNYRDRQVGSLKIRRKEKARSNLTFILALILLTCLAYILIGKFGS